MKDVQVLMMDEGRRKKRKKWMGRMMGVERFL